MDSSAKLVCFKTWKMAFIFQQKNFHLSIFVLQKNKQDTFKFISPLYLSVNVRKYNKNGMNCNEYSSAFSFHQVASAHLLFFSGKLWFWNQYSMQPRPVGNCKRARWGDECRWGTAFLMSMNAACVYMLAHSHKHCLKPVVTAGRKRTSKLVTIQTPQDHKSCLLYTSPSPRDA